MSETKIKAKVSSSEDAVTPEAILQRFHDRVESVRFEYISGTLRTVTVITLREKTGTA
ncbi:MAG TPA: hypothetical protein VFR34_00870 [Paracoccaceae bacterium]|nr:hypothetical protein [Paracoccaceae bacterium]